MAPVKITKGYVDVADGQIHYRMQSDGAGPFLILFHMTASTSESYESLMTALAGDVPTIAIDTPGYGESYKPSAEPSMEYIGKVVLEALDGLGVAKFHTFGHHTGASIALELACAAPDRTLSAMLNGVAAADPGEGEEMERTYAYPNPCDPLGDHILRAWNRIANGLELAPHIQLPPELMHRELIAMLKAGENWAWGYRAVFRDNIPEKLKRVTRPVLFVIAEHDGVMPWHIREVERNPRFASYIAPDHGVFYSELAAQDLAPRLREFMQNAEAQVSN